MLTYTPANSTFDGPITNLLSILHILIEILSCTHSKGVKKSYNDFKSDTFIGCFLSGDVASMAVKGLTINTANPFLRNDLAYDDAPPY